MKKSIWIFLLAVLAPGIVLGWLALRSAEEQQIIFERRTAELYQKETENLADAVRKIVEEERRSFGDVVHRLLANGDAEALARDFTYTLTDVWPRKAVGFALSADGQMLSPSATVASANPSWREFLWNNGSFLCSTKPAVVYPVPSGKVSTANVYANPQRLQSAAPELAGKPALQVAAVNEPTVIAQKTGAQDEEKRMVMMKEPAEKPEAAVEKPEDAKMDSAGAADADKASATRPGRLEIPAPSAKASAQRAFAPPANASARGGGENEGAAIAPLRTAPATPGPETLGAPTRGAREPIDAKATESAGMLTRNEAVPPPQAPVDAPRPDADSGFKAIVPQQTPGLLDERNAGRDQRRVSVSEESQFRQTVANRMVEPQQQVSSPAANWSSVVPATADFSTLTGWSDEGMVSRFVQDKLELIFWIRPPEAPDMVFGCLVEAADLRDLWGKLFDAEQASGSVSDAPPFVLALLDDKATPVAKRSPTDGGRDWKRPFVASEIGEMLPHWEAALYLATPTAIIDSARGFRRTLSFTIVSALALIALGGWLVVADVRRQLALAQQKTDFVSNVSHELKTPLTSIRMFAELLHDRPPPQEKQGQYLRIITVEAERLTRLINNVLDFAKLERKQRRFEKKPLDLHELISRVWEGQEMHLQEAGFVTKWEAAPGPYPVIGDEDALAQVLVNLLSNAEKYSLETKDVEMVTWIEERWVNVSVMDRGLGVPEGEENKIFEAFYRAHDSLSSGIQGSGLGLTLACRLAAEHGGEVRYERRKGGGSRFTLRVPLAGKQGTTGDV